MRIHLHYRLPLHSLVTHNLESSKHAIRQNDSNLGEFASGGAGGLSSTKVPTVVGILHTTLGAGPRPGDHIANHKFDIAELRVRDAACVTLGGDHRDQHFH